MKIILLICLLTASFLFTGCDTLEVRQRDRVYERPGYYDGGPRRIYPEDDYRYRRIHDRDVILNDRRDIVVREQPRFYSHTTVIRRDDDRRDDDRRDKHKKKKKHDDRDDHR